jgi:hypothetical protein
MAIKPDSMVRLLSNVPFSLSQDHVRDFVSVTDQSNYFLSKSKYTFTQFTYVREEQAIKVPVNIDELYEINYLMYRNANYSNKWFYAFVTRKEYVNPNTTAIFFEMDVYQTWQHDVSVKPSYVIREHTDRWNSDGSPVINTVDEGLDYGSDYETVSMENYRPFDDIYFLVAVTKSNMHTTDTNKVNPTVIGYPQPLNYYIHPFRLDGSVPTVSVGGSSVGLSNARDFLEGLFTQESAVENVVSLYITEYFDNISHTESGLSFSSTDFEKVYVSDDQNLNITTIRVKELKYFRSKIHSFGDKYKDFYKGSESKLLMYPYTVTILDDFKGNRIELKNEYIKSDVLNVRVKGSLGTSNKVSYQVDSYLNENEIADQTIGLERAVINNNPNDVPIITEMLSAYLQGNRNTLENQKSSMLFNAFTSTLTGAIGGGIGGGRLGLIGAIGGATVGAINSYYQIESLNAKQRDIENTPPNLVSRGGNTSFDYGNDISGLYVIKKQITKENRNRLEQFFKMYGYKVNTLKVPNLRTRQHFNFVHTVSINLIGNIPQDDLDRLKEIYNKGVTIWHGDYVGDYSKVNGEV